MILCEIEKVDRGENGIGDDGILGNPHWEDFDVNDRSHWAYVGLSDEEFEEKREILEDNKKLKDEARKNHEPIDYIDVFKTWDFGGFGNGILKFFAIYELDDKDECGEPVEPIGYLAIRHFKSSIYNYLEEIDRAMVLAKDVDGWEMGKIQALLTNKMLSKVYHEKRIVEHTVVPFDGIVPDAITAAADDDFVICSAEWNAPKLSAVEKEALDRC